VATCKQGLQEQHQKAAWASRGRTLPMLEGGTLMTACLGATTWPLRDKAPPVDTTSSMQYRMMIVSFTKYLASTSKHG